MIANTSLPHEGHHTFHSKPGGALIWAAGFLILMALTLKVFGATPDQTTSLETALGPDVETARL